MLKKSDRLNMLIKIADFLDKHDKEDEADFIDSMVQEEKLMPEEITVEVPNAELDDLRTIVEALKDSLE